MKYKIIAIISGSLLSAFGGLAQNAIKLVELAKSKKPDFACILIEEHQLRVSSKDIARLAALINSTSICSHLITSDSSFIPKTRTTESILATWFLLQLIDHQGYVRSTGTHTVTENDVRRVKLWLLTQGPIKKL